MKSLLLFSLFSAIAISLLTTTSVAGEESSSYVESNEFRKSKEQLDNTNDPSKKTGQVVLRRRVVRKKIGTTASPAEDVEERETPSLPSSTLNTRRPLFAARNQRPLFKNRSLKEEIGKIQEKVKKLVPKKVVAAETTTAPTTTPRPTKRPASKKTTTAKPEESPEDETAEEDNNNEESVGKKNSSMIIIPVPPSQRKPYHPVIMQVTKSPPTEQSTAQSRVVTYKLNKMFVPMGIYGKVLSKSEQEQELESTVTENSLVSTPLPFLLPGQNQNNSNSGEVSIRHKGTDSGETQKKDSESESQENSDKKWENLLKEIKAKNKKTRKSKDHQRIADTIDITYNYKPDVNKISLTTPRMDPARISLTTEMPPMSGAIGSNYYGSQSVKNNNINNNRKQWNSNSHYNKNSMTTMLHPPPMQSSTTAQPKISFGASTFVDSLKDAASNIPSMIHKGITSLSSLTTALSSENPFNDETFAESNERPAYSSIVAAVPGGYVAMPHAKTTTTMSPAEVEYETLEYFRNRPHLINKASRKQFREPSYFSSGFRPVTAPPHLAREYYASTTTLEPKLRTKTEEAPASSNSWKIVAAPSDTRESKMIPTEQDTPGWKTIFQAKEWGTKPAETSSWRSFFGLGPDTESMKPMFNSANLEGGRRREFILDSKWSEIQRKYTKKELTEAKERLFHVISSDAESPYELYEGKIPTRPLNILSELFNMFKIGINFTSGKSSSPIVQFDTLKDTNGASHFGDSSWRPLSKAGGKPLITFSAGITFKGGSGAVSPTVANFLRGGSHFSSSSRPYMPYKYNGHKNHLVDLTHSYITKEAPEIIADYSPGISGSDHSDHYPSSYHYSTAASPSVIESPVEDEHTGDEYSIVSGTSDLGVGSSSGGIADDTEDADGAYSSSSYRQAVAAAVSQYNQDQYKSSGSETEAALEEEGGDNQGSSAYELVPSEVFFSQKNPDMSNIAAVIKPPDISDDLVKAHLPQEISSVPTLDFPTRQLPKYAPQKFSSLSQLSNYLATADPKPSTTKIPLQYSYQKNYQISSEPQTPPPVQVTPQTFQHIQYQQMQQFLQPQSQQPQYQIQAAPQIVQQQPQQSYQQSQPSYQQSQPSYQQYQYSGIPQFQPSQQPFQFNSFNSPSTYMQIMSQQSTQSNNKLKTTGDKTVGFSDFELPANIDPDIASLLKSELDKDDIPEEFRQDFEDAKKEESSKNNKASVQSQQTQQSSRRNDNINPFTTPPQNQFAQFAPAPPRQPQQPQQHYQQPMQQASQQNFNFLPGRFNFSPMNFQPRPLFSNLNSLNPFTNFHMNNQYKNLHHLQQQQHFKKAPINNHLSSPPKVITKFHAPVPISPTMMSQSAMFRGRYNSPVPRYVVELAKKLQKDKDVQGIVRVSTKRAKGPPIEYLYPVRG